MLGSDLVKMVANRNADQLRSLAHCDLVAGELESLVGAVVSSFLDSLALSLICDEPVVLRGFGRFEPQHRQARVMKHPKTGEDFSVPARSTVGFAPAAALKERVRGER